MFRLKNYVYMFYQEMSFSKADKRLFISQPSLSAAVKKEEEELGFPIFDRSTSPIQLTDFGKHYINSVEQIMSVEDNFTQYVNDLSELKAGSITIGATNLFTAYLLPPIMRAFCEKFPYVTIKLVGGETAELVDKLTTGKIHILVDNTELDPQIFDQKFCCTDELVLTVPREFPSNKKVASYALTTSDIQKGKHLSAKFPSVPLEVFQDDPFCLLRPGNNSRERAYAICSKHGFQPKVAIEPEQQITAFNLSSCGIGISFCGDLLIQNIPIQDNLLYYKLDSPESRISVKAFYRRSCYLPKAMQEFLKML